MAKISEVEAHINNDMMVILSQALSVRHGQDDKYCN
jgi:hypothetical protein